MSKGTRTITVQIACEENACGSCRFCTNFFRKSQATKYCVIFDKDLVTTPQGIERLKECKEKEI